MLHYQKLPYTFHRVKTFRKSNWIKLYKLCQRWSFYCNKVNLRDLIAATRLVTLFGLCDLEIGPMALKNNRELFPCPFSFVCHFIAISALDLDLQSRNAQIGSNLTIFCPPWPWNFTDDHEKQKGTSSIPIQALCIIPQPLVGLDLSYSPETLKSGQIWRLFASCDLEILWMMLYSKTGVNPLNII